MIRARTLFQQFANYCRVDNFMDSDGNRRPANDCPYPRERVKGLGPALRRRQGNSSIYINAYQEYGARNRSQGSRLILGYSPTF